MTKENKNCPCSETSCSRHGKCSEFQAYHHVRSEKTSCGK